MARLHYLSPYFLYILADLLTLALPNATCLVVFQVATMFCRWSLILFQAVRATLVFGSFIKELLGTRASSGEEKK